MSLLFELWRSCRESNRPSPCMVDWLPAPNEPTLDHEGGFYSPAKHISITFFSECKIRTAPPLT